ncbi:MAG: tetratricopeptide repeat protein [Candidatus Parabeggiatoa sp.]|nr:tetratricopeptide repeat protein [Candidatus Parabeggiatoa sp.]
MKSDDFSMRLSAWYIQTLLLAIVVALVYGHTLDVPFYLDDFSSIQENPLIYNWQGTWADFWQLWASYQLRTVGYLSFALNYQVHQFQVAGYHLVNILIHFLTGFAVLGFLRGLVRTPTLNPLLSENTKRWLPFVVALIFVLHPLQIQGVTYIVQRLASLAALFYIAAMACFIQARLTKKSLFRIGGIIATISLALLAFLTKQNTITLFIAILLLELIFFHRETIRIKGTVAILGFGILIGSLVLVLEQNPVFQTQLFEQLPVLEKLDAFTRETTEISRTAYLATQMNVLWEYIGLFLSPASSHIDYDNNRFITTSFLYAHDNYHIIARILHSEPIWALIGHLLLLGLAVLSLRRWPLMAYGILFYYLAHAVESSLIPIRDVIFEHRTYLPNLGLAILCAWLLVAQLPRWLNKLTRSSLAVLSITVVLVLVLGSATWLRNQMWRDPITLWQHNVAQSPEKSRGWIILGKHFIQNGQPAEGIKALNHAIVKKTNADGSQSLSVTTETALNMAVAYKMLKQYDKALEWINSSLALKHNLRPFDHAKFLVNKGNIFFELARLSDKQGDYSKGYAQFSQSEASYRQAIQIYPANLKAHINLASVLATKGLFDEAIALYQQVLAIDPSNVYVKGNLQKLQEIRQNR